jgi:hypothetical protein
MFPDKPGLFRDLHRARITDAARVRGQVVADVVRHVGGRLVSSPKWFCKPYMIRTQLAAGSSPGWNVMWHSPHSLAVIASCTGGTRSRSSAVTAAGVRQATVKITEKKRRIVPALSARSGR